MRCDEHGLKFVLFDQRFAAPALTFSLLSFFMECHLVDVESAVALLAHESKRVFPLPLTSERKPVEHGTDLASSPHHVAGKGVGQRSIHVYLLVLEPRSGIRD